MDIFQVVQLVVIGPTLIFIGLQVLFQRRQANNQVLVQGHELYYMLTRQYIELLRESDSMPILNSVWLPLDEERQRELQLAQDADEWGAWREMTNEERTCYRYVRAAIEIFEQTFQLYSKEWIDAETWDKWRGWIVNGQKMRYFDLVLEDTKPGLVRSFVNELELMRG